MINKLIPLHIISEDIITQIHSILKLLYITINDNGILMKLNIIPFIKGYLVNEIPFKNPVVAISTHIRISEIERILK